MTTVARAIRAALNTPEPRAKCFATRQLARDWRAGRLAWEFDAAMPDQPAWPERPELLPPNQMPKRGKGGSERARIALWHSLAHIEFVAIDLALDMAGRFGAEMGPEFVSDFLAVAADEAMHFALLARKLETLGSHYGALPAHRRAVGGRLRHPPRCCRAACRGADGARSARAGRDADDAGTRRGERRCERRENPHKDT